jgi:hypothetical protein
MKTVKRKISAWNKEWITGSRKNRFNDDVTGWYFGVSSIWSRRTEILVFLEPRTSSSSKRNLPPRPYERDPEISASHQNDRIFFSNLMSLCMEATNIFQVPQLFPTFIWKLPWNLFHTSCMCSWNVLEMTCDEKKRLSGREIDWETGERRRFFKFKKIYISGLIPYSLSLLFSFWENYCTHFEFSCALQISFSTYCFPVDNLKLFSAY